MFSLLLAYLSQQCRLYVQWKYRPCIADRYDGSDVAHDCREHLVSPHLAFPTQTKEAVIRQDSSDSHRSSTDDGFACHTAQTSMSVYDVNLFPNEDRS